MSLTDVHAALARSSLIFSLIIAGYGFWRYLRRQEPAVDASFLGALAVGEILFLAQGVLGLILWGSGRTFERLWVHILYGVVLVITLPGGFAYLRGGNSRREALIYAVLGLFLAGVSLRAMSVAGA